MTAPATASLSPGAPGTTISGALGTVTVVDDRAALAATWTAAASCTDFTNTTIPAAASIPAGDATYGPGTMHRDHHRGRRPRYTHHALRHRPARRGRHRRHRGQHRHLGPDIAVNVPIAAVNGGYTGTLTQSVS